MSFDLKNVIDSAQIAVKIAAWGMISGTALTGASYYYAKRKADEKKSILPYVIAGICTPITFASGAFVGACLKGGYCPSLQEVAGIGNFVIQEGVSGAFNLFVTTPFNFARWLLT